MASRPSRRPARASRPERRNLLLRRCVSQRVRRMPVRERTFKRLALATTLVGVVVMAIALEQALLVGRLALGALLFALGGAVALTSVVVEPIPEPRFVVTLYTREGCTLCDAARDFLVGKKSEYDFDIWLVDV